MIGTSATQDRFTLRPFMPNGSRSRLNDAAAQTEGYSIVPTQAPKRSTPSQKAEVIDRRGSWLNVKAVEFSTVIRIG
jgi:hypothetical protein